jgi:hypothetical protein
MKLNPTAHAGRRLLPGVPLICAAILLPAAAVAASGTPGYPAAAALPLASSANGAAAHPQHRQLAVTTLSSFKVALTITRSPGTALLGTVTAAGYRHTSRGWKLIATKRIGGASGWFWYPTEVCSLTVTQSKRTPTGSPSVMTWDSITVSLLETPALGCSNTLTKRWRR